MNNVFSKLQQARVNLQKIEIKKSGKNSYSGYDYFELSDILPHINREFLELGLCSFINYGEYESTLTIVNSEAPTENIIFTTPTKGASLKGCHEVQNLGAVQSYLRRYLYMTALEIVEHDILDSTTGKDKPQNVKASNNTTKAPGNTTGLTEGQIKRVFAIAKKKDITKDRIDGYISKNFKKTSLTELTKVEYDLLCKALEG